MPTAYATGCVRHETPGRSPGWEPAVYADPGCKQGTGPARKPDGPYPLPTEHGALHGRPGWRRAAPQMTREARGQVPAALQKPRITHETAPVQGPGSPYPLAEPAPHGTAVAESGTGGPILSPAWTPPAASPQHGTA